MSKSYNLGYKDPSEIIGKNGTFLNVGIHQCHQGSVDDDWCNDCKAGKGFIQIHILYTPQDI